MSIRDIFFVNDFNNVSFLVTRLRAQRKHRPLDHGEIGRDDVEEYIARALERDGRVVVHVGAF